MRLPVAKPALPVSPRGAGRVDSSVVGMGASIATLHLLSWFTLIAIVAPQHLSVDGKAFGIGLGLTAHTLGMRHAFDADHIAAIDNTTRKLMGEGKRPLSVGFSRSDMPASYLSSRCCLRSEFARSSGR